MWKPSEERPKKAKVARCAHKENKMRISNNNSKVDGDLREMTVMGVIE